MTYSYDEEPKKHKAELSARDRKIDYLEELVRTGIEQQKKWQKKYFEMKEVYDKYVEANNGTKSTSPENMQ